VEDAEFAFEEAVKRGAKSAADVANKLPYPAIYGIGDSLNIYRNVERTKNDR
jgi:4-hydroxyphenylpyruvate dioxygenase